MDYSRPSTQSSRGWSLLKKGVRRRGRRTGEADSLAHDALVPSLLKTFPWVHTCRDPPQETRLGRKGASQYWQGLGGAGWKRKDSFWLSPPVAGGQSCFLAHLQGLRGGGWRRSWGFRILLLSQVSFRLKRGHEPMVRLPRDK